MLVFLFVGENLLHLFGIDISSFAVAGSIVIFIIAIEMILGIDLFRNDPDEKSGSIIPIAFPIIAGSGTLTTIISLKAAFGIEIPYIDGIFELVKWLFGQTDQVVNAIMTLISFGTVVYGFFKSGFRFEQIVASKANSKGRKYYQ